MLISIIVLKFESTDTLVACYDVIIFKGNENLKLPIQLSKSDGSKISNLETSPWQ